MSDAASVKSIPSLAPSPAPPVPPTEGVVGEVGEVGVVGVVRGALRKGVAAARANLVPALVVQAVAVSLLVGYYAWPAFAELLGRVAALKEAYGYAYSAVGMLIAALLLPLLLQLLTAHRTRLTAGAFALLVVFWMTRGVEVDALYRLQGWLFGYEVTVGTVLIKLAVDQFGYTLFWAQPSLVLIYRLKDGRPLPRGWPAWKAWYLRDVLPVLLSGWAIWIPAVAVIYALTGPLQIPVSNLVTAMWVTIFTFLSRPDE